MAGGHGSESSGIYRVRKQVDQLGEIVVRYEGIGGGKKFEFRGVGREDLAEGPLTLLLRQERIGEVRE